MSRIGWLPAIGALLPAVAAAQPRVLVEPSQIDVGPVTLAATASRALHVRNVGDAALTVSRVALLDPFHRDAWRFQTPALPLAIAPGDSMTIAIDFQPVSTGSFPAELEVDADDSMARSTRIPLDGRGVRASWSVTPRSVAFRSILLDDVSAPQVVTLRNTGLFPVALSPPRLEGAGAAQFRAAGSGATTLAVGQTESYVVTSQPDAPGQHVARLVITAGGAPPVSVSLAATAVAATLADPPVEWSFGGVVAGTRSAPHDFAVTLEPIGVGGRLLAVASSNPLFTVDTAGTRWALGPGESTALRVRFEPTATGEATAILTVIAAGELGPLVVARLHGVGVSDEPPAPGFCTVGGRTPARRGGATGALLLGLAALLGGRAARWRPRPRR